MITCKSCGKENQDHYKFCLGCGGELSRLTSTAGTAAPSALETARTVLPPAPVMAAVLAIVARTRPFGLGLLLACGFGWLVLLCICGGVFR